MKYTLRNTYTGYEIYCDNKAELLQQIEKMLKDTDYEFINIKRKNIYQLGELIYGDWKII